MEKLVRELMLLCERENLPVKISPESLCLRILGTQKRSIFESDEIKFSGNMSGLARYAAYRVSQIRKRRLPEALHNMMLLDSSGCRFVKSYVELVNGLA